MVKGPLVVTRWLTKQVPPWQAYAMPQDAFSMPPQQQGQCMYLTEVLVGLALLMHLCPGAGALCGRGSQLPSVQGYASEKIEMGPLAKGPLAVIRLRF